MRRVARTGFTAFLLPVVFTLAHVLIAISDYNTKSARFY
jgi:hypothetical protein